MENRDRAQKRFAKQLFPIAGTVAMGHGTKIGSKVEYEEFCRQLEYLAYEIGWIDQEDIANKTPSGAFEALVQDIEKTIAGAEGGWEIRWDNTLVVTTQESDNPSKSNNGGDYYYYREFQTDGLGVIAYDDWSCDFANYASYRNEDRREYDCIISVDGLRRIAQLAEVTIAAKAWLAKEPGCMKRLKSAIRAMEVE